MGFINLYPKKMQCKFELPKRKTQYIWQFLGNDRQSFQLQEIDRKFFEGDKVISSFNQSADEKRRITRWLIKLVSIISLIKEYDWHFV
jgi:hypothetical protein